MTESHLKFNFPSLNYGVTETPWDLSPLLYKGGAAAKSKNVQQLILEGKLGAVLPERIHLVTLIHQLLLEDIANGGSRYSLKNKIIVLRIFFSWVDTTQNPISIDSVSEIYVEWTDHLVHRFRVERSLSDCSAYDFSRIVGTLLDRVLDNKIGLCTITRIRKPRSKRRRHAGTNDKQNLEETFRFGHFLVDICNNLTLEKTIDKFPISILFRTGQTYEYWGRLKNLPKKNDRNFECKTWNIPKIDIGMTPCEREEILRTRSRLINLRIESEMLIFIAQTGMNLQQAHTLRLEQFHYTSHLDGYQVRSYKNRRQGEVLFEIYADYRKWLKTYLSWRANWFPENSEGLLFPLVRTGGRIKEEAPQFTSLLALCGAMDVSLIRARKLRGTRINWLLRQSKNPNQVAELAQHTLQTLIRVYEDPHPQTAMVEIAKFHHEMDSSLEAPAPGICVEQSPKAFHNIKNAPSPDCINPAGCLFCTQHRDIESEDHVWSLASLRHLKSLELARHRPPSTMKSASLPSPALMVVERLTAKLRFFEESNEKHKHWTHEAYERVREGEYHPAWDGFIQLAEGVLHTQNE